MDQFLEKDKAGHRHFWARSKKAGKAEICHIKINPSSILMF
jgi:hypothetical protein